MHINASWEDLNNGKQGHYPQIRRGTMIVANAYFSRRETVFSYRHAMLNSFQIPRDEHATDPIYQTSSKSYA